MSRDGEEEDMLTQTITAMETINQEARELDSSADTRTQGREKGTVFSKAASEPKARVSLCLRANPVLFIS